MWSRDVSFLVSSLPTSSLLDWVISLQQGVNLEWPYHVAYSKSTTINNLGYKSLCLTNLGN